MKRIINFSRASAQLALIASFAALIVACGSPVDTEDAALSQNPASSASILQSLGSASKFSVLGGTNVTCTSGSIGGDVGVSPGSAVPFTNTGCSIAGLTPPATDLDAAQARADFLGSYDALRSLACIAVPGNLAGQSLAPGVYCLDAVAKAGTLTLAGPSDGTWVFLVDGALTGTSFSVVMAEGGQAGNVFWVPSAAATMTTSAFSGSILAGDAIGGSITFTGGTLTGRALANVAVTITGTDVAAAPITAPVPVTAPGAGTGVGGLGQGPAPVNLLSAGNFVILSKSGITTTGVTAVTGNLGVSPIAATAITGFGSIADASGEFSTSSLVTGQVFAADYAVPTPSNLTTAVLNMQAAYSDAAGRAPDYTELGSGNIGGLNLGPATYKWSTVVLIPTDVTLTGGANDVWIFEIAQGLTVSSGVRVKLVGGALAKNVFWQVAGVVALGTTAHFEGIALGQTGIALNTGASVNGRLLAQTAVTLIANAVVQPAL